MGETERTFEEVVGALVEDALLDVHTSMPGIVTGYNPLKNSVDVQPQIKRSLEDENGDIQHESLPVIYDVPIAWPRGGGCWITWPLAAGDPVLLVFCEQDPGVWRSNGKEDSSGDLRRHGLSGAVAYPGGAFPDSTALDSSKVGDGVVLGPNVLLGSASAAQKMVLGTDQAAALQTVFSALTTYHAALATFCAAIVPVTGVAAPAQVAIATADGVFTSALGAFDPTASLSAKHKLDS